MMNETISISTKKDFEMIKQIGKGSFGVVYKCKRKRDGQIYAMKSMDISKMDTKSIENCLNEIRILCAVVHPNIVGYKEAFLDNNGKELNIIMEFVGGGDLSTKVEQCSKRKLLINESTIWKYLIQILLGLRDLHRLKIIHRDIKSANLFLSEDFETIKLGDLNVAKIAKNDLASTQIGTPYYLAPEIWKNEIYSYKCDVFSTGCVVYEMAALKVPFEAVSMQDLYRKITRGLISKISKEYSDDLYSIIKMCLTVDPKYRPTVDQLLSHPLIKTKMAAFGMNLQKDQVVLENLMQTIKLEKKLNKLNINLPRTKKYRSHSAAGLIVNPDNQPTPSSINIKKVPDNQVSSNKINVLNPLEKLQNSQKETSNRSLNKAPPVKINSKPVFEKPVEVQRSRERSSSRNNRSVDKAPNSKEKVKPVETPSSRYKAYLDKLIEENNRYIQERGIVNDSNRSRKRGSSADPKNAYQQNYPNPKWWG